jgi:hypothetical protein
VDLDGSIEDDVVRGLIADSYDLVVARLPRSNRAELVTDRPSTGAERCSLLAPAMTSGRRPASDVGVAEGMPHLDAQVRCLSRVRLFRSDVPSCVNAAA